MSREFRLGPTRADVLHHLRDLGEGASAADVAAVLGLHPNTTRFHLDALVAQGLVVREAEQRTLPGRPRVLYRAVDGHRTNRYQELAGAMVRHFAGPMDDRAALARAAGQTWGEGLREEFVRANLPRSPLHRLMACMADLGYAPTIEESQPDKLVLRPCPFEDLAGDDPEVVCQLHLGLMSGLLGDDQPLRVRSLRPWATQTRCEADLVTEDAPAPSVAPKGALDA